MKVPLAALKDINLSSKSGRASTLSKNHWLSPLYRVFLVEDERTEKRYAMKVLCQGIGTNTGKSSSDKKKQIMLS